MAIKEMIFESKACFQVSVHLRSKTNRDIRVQLTRSGIPTLRQAQLVEKELIREAAEQLARREGKGITWAELLEQWEDAHAKGRIGTKVIQKNTIWDTIATLRRFTGHWMEIACEEISPGDVRKVMTQMEEDGYSKSRLRAVKSGINVAFKWGIEEGLVKNVRNSPAFGVELGLAVQTKPPQILSVSEIQTLLPTAREMDHEWYPVWAMALNSGMRSGELFALEWSDVDFDNKLLTVSKSYNGRMKITKSTKAGYWRKVPINADLESLLKELKSQAKDGETHVLPRIRQWRRGEGARVLREYCEGIGIQPVCFHALRACFATHLLNAGVTSPVVKKICGWTDEKVMGRYIRLAGIDVAGATEGLGFVSQDHGERRIVNLRDFRITRGGFDK